ncbi:hypothetical protein GCM10027063_10900 [Promicromonospora xylanilytica]
MTTPQPDRRATPAPPAPFGRTGVFTLAAALLLAVSGLFAVPGVVFSAAYYTNAWAVVAFVAPILTVSMLVLAGAAVARGSQTFLLVVSVTTVLYLVSLVWLGLPADGGVARADTLSRLWSAPIQLALALVALALAWWISSRTDRRPWAPLILVALAPVLARIPGTGAYWDAAWLPVLVVALGIPAALTILAAGLVSLPDRGPQITGAVLIVLAGLGVYGSSLVLGRQPVPSVLVAMGLAFVCALAAILAPSRRVADGDGQHPGSEDADQLDTGSLDEAAGVASTAAADAEVVTMSDTAVVVVPSSRPEADDDAGTRPPFASRRIRTLTLAALTVLVLTVALAVPRMFAYGPGIQPGGAGLVSLTGLLVNASTFTAFVLAAGAATLRVRGVLLTATVFAGALGLALLVSWTAAGGTVDLRAGLPFIALGLSLALAWAGVLRPGHGSTAWRWLAVVPLVLAAPPIQSLTNPGITVYASNPAFLPQFVLPILVSGLAPLLAAALLGYPHRRTRIAAAVLLGAAAIAAVVGTMENAAASLALATALRLLQVGGYALAGVLVVGALRAPEPGR